MTFCTLASTPFPLLALRSPPPATGGGAQVLPGRPLPVSCLAAGNGLAVFKWGGGELPLSMSPHEIAELREKFRDPASPDIKPPLTGDGA